MKKLILLVWVFVGFFVSGCSSKTYTIEIHPKKENNNTPKKVALFLDGTANNLKSRTNISKLFNIVANQDRDNLYLFYNEGVGTKGVGLGTGTGLGKDVREAYQFLTKEYSKDSELYIFGFSRGAYTGRVLAGMIYTIGIYNLNNFSKIDRKKIIDELYDVYKGKNKKRDKIKIEANQIVENWKILKKKKNISSVDNVEIKIMGLWDTVEAMGITSTWEAIKEKAGKEDDKQNIVNPNLKYFDQICNMKHVLHALSLDDNRANLFTPIIMTSNYMIEKCENKNDINISKKVNEVWFAGAHADVGGGYRENNTLSGISLNWMITQINNLEINDKFKLLPINIKIYQNENGYIHDAENGLKSIYSFAIRDKILKKYIEEKSVYKKIKIHKSVISRLKYKGCKEEYNSKWYTNSIFKNCFHLDNKGKIIKFMEKEKECKEILEIIKTKKN